jgi:hypothetical protein
VEFKVNGRLVRVTREQVVAAVRGVRPGRIQTHAVEIDRTWYPAKQAFALATGLPRADFISLQARRAFMRMGFRVSCWPRPSRRPKLPQGDGADGRPALKPQNRVDAIMPAESELFALATLLEWSWWEWWDDLREDDRAGDAVEVPREPGVYEVKRYGEDERLYIGRARDLQMRVKHGLVIGSSPHPAGRKIEASEDTSRVCVRWAETDRPAAAEEELHRRHVLQFGSLPKYAQHT